MAAPKGFRSWQDYFNRHIAECESCAPIFEGEQLSVEGTESYLDEVPYAIGIPERLAKRVIAEGSCDGCHASLDGMIHVWTRPTPSRGRAHGYLADRDMTAISEVLDNDGGVAWIQRFKIEPWARLGSLHIHRRA